MQARRLAGLAGKPVNETLENIRTNIDSRLSEMKPLIAHLDMAASERPPFSLTRFIQDPKSGILVISKTEKYAIAQDAMNGVIFQRLTQLLEDEQADPRRKLFIFIDEFPALCGDSRCPGVKAMFLRLRSRGAVPLITDQGLTTLKPIYEGDTTALLGQCSNKIFLRQPDVESAEEAAKDLGIERGYEKKKTNSSSGKFLTFGDSYFQYDRSIIPAGILKDLHLASKKSGISGYAASAMNEGQKPWPFHIEPEEVDAIPPTNPAIRNYVKRGSAHRLRELDDGERRALMKDEGREEGDEWMAFLES